MIGKEKQHLCPAKEQSVLSEYTLMRGQATLILFFLLLVVFFERESEHWYIF